MMPVVDEELEATEINDDLVEVLDCLNVNVDVEVLVLCVVVLVVRVM